MYDKLKQTLNSISRIEDADWLMMEPFLKQKHFRKNEFFLQSGEIGKQLGFIVSGSFRWYFINKKGEEMNFHFFFENSFIVEYQSFISQEPSSMFIQAMEDSTIILLPHETRFSSSMENRIIGQNLDEKLLNTFMLVQPTVFRIFYFIPQKNATSI